MFGNSLIATGGVEEEQLPTTDGLVAYYPLTGTAEDHYGEGGNESGVEYNGVSFVDESIIDGRVAEFPTSATGYIDIPSVSVTDECSISFWMKLDSTANTYDSNILEGTGGTYTSIQPTHTNNTMITWLGASSPVSGTVVLSYSYTELKHYTLIKKSDTTVDIYENGVYKGNQAGGAASALSFTRISSTSSGQNGITLSNLRIYNTALTVQEVTDLYNQSNEPTAGLIAHYKLDGDSTDETGNYNGTATNVVYSEQRGDSVASFDGVNDYIGIDNLNISTTSSFTVSAWVKIQSYHVDYSTIAGFWKDSSFNVEIDNTGKVRLHSYDTIHHYATSVGNVPLDTWTYVSVSRDSSTNTHITIGSQRETLSGVPDSADLHRGDSIGGRVTVLNTTVENILDGKLSDVRIYDRVLTQAEITDLYNEENETTDGLVAHYPLTKEWRANDAWVAYDGTEVGVTYVDDVDRESVAVFDGTNSYIDTGNNTLGKVITFSVWLNRSSNSDEYGTVAGFCNNDVTFGIRSSINGTLVWTYQGGSYTSSTSVVVPPINEWYHLLVTYNDGAITIHINGIELLSQTIAAGETGRTNGNGIGTSIFQNGTNVRFQGKMSNARIYNRALTPTEIDTIYNYELTNRYVKVTDGLVAYYPLKKNSDDNWYNQYDGIDTGVTYDGNSAVFDGVNDYISTSLTNLTGAMSLCGFVKFNNTLSGYQTLFGSTDSSRDRGIIVFIDSTGIVRFGAYETGAPGPYFSVTGTTVLQSNTFYHITCTFNGTTDVDGVKIYIDSVLEEEGASRSTTVESQGLKLGISGDYLDFDLSGVLGMARVYDKELTEEEITEIYNLEKGEFE